MRILTEYKQIPQFPIFWVNRGGKVLNSLTGRYREPDKQGCVSLVNFMGVGTFKVSDVVACTFDGTSLHGFLSVPSSGGLSLNDDCPLLPDDDGYRYHYIGKKGTPPKTDPVVPKEPDNSPTPTVRIWNLHKHAPKSMDRATVRDIIKLSGCEVLVQPESGVGFVHYITGTRKQLTTLMHKFPYGCGIYTFIFAALYGSLQDEWATRKEGKPLQSLSKYGVGSVHSTESHGDVVITEVHEKRKVTIQFACGTTKLLRNDQIPTASPTERGSMIGRTYSTKTAGDIEVLSVSGTKAIVRFDDSSTREVQTSAVRSGKIAHPSKVRTTTANSTRAV